MVEDMFARVDETKEDKWCFLCAGSDQGGGGALLAWINFAGVAICLFGLKQECRYLRCEWELDQYLYIIAKSQVRGLGFVILRPASPELHCEPGTCSTRRVKDLPCE